MQQINLYLPEFHPRKEWLLWPQAWLATLMFVVLLAAISLSGSYRNHQLASQLQQLQRDIADVKLSVEREQASITPNKAAQLQAEVDNLYKVLASRQRVYELINQQNLGNSDGFDEPLLAMARQHKTDLSISRFVLASGGRQLYMSGDALSAQALPQYLQRLKMEPSFQQTRFGRLLVTRESSGKMAFSTGPDVESGEP